MDMVESLLKKGERVVYSAVDNAEPFDVIIHRVFARNQKTTGMVAPELEFMVIEGETVNKSGVSQRYTSSTSYSQCEAMNLDKIGGVWRIL